MEDPAYDESLGSASKRSLRTTIVVLKVWIVVALLGAYGFYFGYVWLNAQWFHGYPQYGSLPVPGTPDQFVSQRYGFDWWVYASLALQYWTVAAAAFAVAKPRENMRSQLAIILGIVAIILSVATFLILFFGYYCVCNSGSWPNNRFNSCNDPRWCCEHHASTAATGGLCPNTVDCAPQPTELEPNSFYTWTLWASGLGFPLLNTFTIVLLGMMDLYSVRSGLK